MLYNFSRSTCQTQLKSDARPTTTRRILADLGSGPECTPQVRTYFTTMSLIDTRENSARAQKGLTSSARLQSGVQTLSSKHLSLLRILSIISIAQNWDCEFVYRIVLLIIQESCIVLMARR